MDNFARDMESEIRFHMTEKSTQRDASWDFIGCMTSLGTRLGSGAMLWTISPDEGPWVFSIADVTDFLDSLSSTEAYRRWSEDHDWVDDMLAKDDATLKQYLDGLDIGYEYTDWEPDSNPDSPGEYEE